MLPRPRLHATTTSALVGTVAALIVSMLLLVPAQAGLTKISGSMIQDGAIQSQHLAAGLATFPSGTVVAYGGSAAPTGWYLCDGSEYDEVAYPALYTALGTTYGGTASAPLLPDLRGRAVLGKDNMGGTAANRITSGGSGITGTTLGASGGLETVTLTTAQMPSHNHGVTDPGHTHAASQGSYALNVTSGGSGAPTAGATLIGANYTASGTTGVTIQNTGGGGAHNNTPPAIVLNYIVKQ